MPTLTLSRPAGGDLVAAFDRAERERRHEPAWLCAMRGSAMAAFERLGFPTTRDEGWRFTNVAPIAETSFAPARSSGEVSRETVNRFAVPGLSGPLVVFVDGRYAPALSALDVSPSGVWLRSLADAIETDAGRLEPYLARVAAFGSRPFAALNTALFEDGVVVDVAASTIVEHPIQIIFLSTDAGVPVMSHPRVLVLAGPNSQVRVIETYGGAGRSGGLTNAVTEIAVGDGAVVDSYRLQREGDRAFHIGLTEFHLSRASACSSHAVALGGLISRHDANVVLGGEGASCTLNGLYWADGLRLVDNHTVIDHAKPHGTSHEVYKGILGGRARGVFDGRIHVRPDAQKTDAKQTSKTLLLSDEAQVNTKPQLEIFANDVRCTHGATVGQLSEEALFYLRSRGIGREAARRILVRAFASDVTSRMALEPVRTEVDRLLAACLAAHGEGAPTDFHHGLPAAAPGAEVSE